MHHTLLDQVAGLKFLCFSILGSALAMRQFTLSVDVATVLVSKNGINKVFRISNSMEPAIEWCRMMYFIFVGQQPGS